MPGKAIYIESPSTNPYENLAVERHLFLTCPEDTLIMFLWQNDNTIVIGRNQNAYGECNIDNIDAAGARIARRHTGGGAVFHDMGNLNFSFIFTVEDNNDKIPAEIIQAACKTFGIDAQISGRNDITCDGRKFSGNAFCRSGKIMLAHGTIMVNLDTSKLSGYLNVSKEKLASKGVKSVSSRVINLGEVCPDLTVQTFKDTLHKVFCDRYSDRVTNLEYKDVLLDEDTQKIAKEYASKEWILGGAKDHNFVKSHRFPWGTCEINLMISDHRIDDGVVYSDAMVPDLIENINGALRGCRWDYAAVREALFSLITDIPDEKDVIFPVDRKQIISDILELLKES